MHDGTEDTGPLHDDGAETEVGAETGVEVGAEVEAHGAAGIRGTEVFEDSTGVWFCAVYSGPELF
ncbi:hypothetical protein [Streptomyces sp. NPDC006739]|uniref:hypothetical protein n=1 Tax=Streptomyces sp. NPDC006739 TaxID=3364763 RepID=UPI0036D045BC